MTLYYEWGFDLALLEGASVIVTDSSGAAGADRTFTATMSTGTYAHTAISSVSATSTFTAFASALGTALEAGSALGATPRLYQVTWSRTTGYFVKVLSGSTLTLDLTGTTAQTTMAHILGMSGDRTGALEYNSQVRPYYFIIPTIQARSEMTDETEPPDVAAEGRADDGSAVQISADTAATDSDWIQAAEPTTEPSGFTWDDPWTPPFQRQATSAVPWTYQHAFRHARTGAASGTATLPFLAVEGSESSVHSLRPPAGTSFMPMRFAGRDIEIWSIPFRTQLHGRL